MHRIRHWTILLVALTSRLCAADTEPAENTDGKLSDEGLRMRGVFDSNLPGIERKHSLKLILHPHFGDLVKYDYLRTPIGLKYAVSSRFEVAGELESYFSHGLGDVGFFKKAGVGEMHFRAKYRLGEHIWRDWDMATGFDYSTPTGHPPSEVTDGLEHKVLWVSFARPLARHPQVRVFWGTGIDWIRDTAIAGEVEDNDLVESNNFGNVGVVWDRGAVHYTFETKVATTRLLGTVDEDVIELRPGVIWEVPSRHTFNSKGQWVLGMSVSSKLGPDKTEWGLGVRVRVDIDAKKLLGRKKSVEPVQP